MTEQPRRNQYRCHFCGKVDGTVQMRYCGYDLAHGEQVTEISCDDCEDLHELELEREETERGVKP